MVSEFTLKKKKKEKKEFRYIQFFYVYVSVGMFFFSLFFFFLFLKQFLFQLEQKEYSQRSGFFFFFIQGLCFIQNIKVETTAEFKVWPFEQKSGNKQVRRRIQIKGVCSSSVSLEEHKFQYWVYKETSFYFFFITIIIIIFFLFFASTNPLIYIKCHLKIRSKKEYIVSKRYEDKQCVVQHAHTSSDHANITLFPIENSHIKLDVQEGRTGAVSGLATNCERSPSRLWSLSLIVRKLQL